MANVIFDGAQHNRLVTIEGKASAALKAGHVVAATTSAGATTFAKAAYTAGQVTPALLVADKNFLQAGSVADAYALNDEVVVRLLSSGETAFVRVAAGTYNKGAQLYPSATGGTLTATPPAESVPASAIVIENAGEVLVDALVRIAAV